MELMPLGLVEVRPCTQQSGEVLAWQIWKEAADAAALRQPRARARRAPAAGRRGAEPGAERPARAAPAVAGPARRGASGSRGAAPVPPALAVDADLDHPEQDASDAGTLSSSNESESLPRDAGDAGSQEESGEEDDPASADFEELFSEFVAEVFFDTDGGEQNSDGQQPPEGSPAADTERASASSAASLSSSSTSSSSSSAESLAGSGSDDDPGRPRGPQGPRAAAVAEDVFDLSDGHGSLHFNVSGSYMRAHKGQ